MSSAVPAGRRFLQLLPKVVFGSTAFYIFLCEINPTDATSTTFSTTFSTTSTTTSTTGTQRTREETIRRHTLHTGHLGAQKLFRVDFFFFFFLLRLKKRSMNIFHTPGCIPFVFGGPWYVSLVLASSLMYLKTTSARHSSPGLYIRWAGNGEKNGKTREKKKKRRNITYCQVDFFSVHGAT